MYPLVITMHPFIITMYSFVITMHPFIITMYPFIITISISLVPLSPGHTHNITSLSVIPPPINLELTRQFVENNAYCLAIHWEPPKPLPQDITSYNVYVNGELDSTIESTAETFVLLSDIPRNEVNIIIIIVIIIFILLFCS